MRACRRAAAPSLRFGRMPPRDPLSLVVFDTCACLQLAEMMDVFWAPLSALLVHQLYGSTLLSGVALIGCDHPFLPHSSHPLPGVGIRPQPPRVTGIPQIGTASAGAVGAHL